MTRNPITAVSLSFSLLVSSVGQGVAAPDPAKAAREADLFTAIGKRDAAAVRKALAQGADPNARNWLGISPLMLAAGVGDARTMTLLLSRKAELEGESIFGSPLTFATLSGNPEAVGLLIAKGATIQPKRVDGMQPLMMAASQGYLPMAKLLLAKKADVNLKDTEGVTALMQAARSGHTQIAGLLLAKGARIDEKDNRGWTALMYASANGQYEAAQLLMKRGANVHAADKRGRTALALAAHYSGRTDLQRLLAANGAKANGKVRKAAAPAPAANDPLKAAILQVKAGPAPQDSPERSRKAVSTSLAALQTGMVTFSKRVGCVSCHHQGLSLMATGAAREKGFKVDEALAQGEMKKVYNEMVAGPKAIIPLALKDPAVEKQIPAMDINDFSIAVGYAMTGMAAHGQPGDEGTSLAARLLAKQQKPDGKWDFSLPRVPMQSSNFTVTAMAVRTLSAYATEEWKPEAEARIAKAKAWLLSAPARTSDDMAFRLLGLKWAGATEEELQPAADDLRKAQRPDGGWAQEPGLRSDAYATGQALYALNLSGAVTTGDEAYRRGKAYLLKTQDPDGSWYVNKRALPFNIYIDAGFPHGHSQYASFAGTCWATMALLQEFPDAKPAGLVTRKP